MKGLDGRHRWDAGLREDAHITYECLACGKQQTFELLIPDAVIEELLRGLSRPNPYRALFRTSVL
jgi:hypothetical protein